VSRYDQNETYDGSARYDDFTVPLTRKKMKPKLGLDRLKPQEVVALGKTVKAAMTTNAATFPNANPTMVALGALITAAEDGITASDTADATAKLVRTQRDTLVAALAAGLTQEAGYVESRAAGSATIIEQAGMAVKAPSEPIGPMPQVLELAVTASDHEGWLDWMCKPVRGVSSYEVWTSADPMTEASWKFAFSSSKSSGTLKGLTSGSKVWVRVRAVGADTDPGPWSDPAVKVVP